MKTFSKTISLIFHPILIPTIGFLILFNSGSYFSMLSWEIKRFIIIAVFFSTAILPILTVSVLALNPKFNFRMDKHTDRIVPLAFTSVYYYLGYFLIGKIYIYPVFKVFLIASVLVIIALLLISFKWKISNHLAAIGGFTGTIIALSYRMGMNPVMIIISTIIVAGLVGSARIYLEKHSLPQVLAGFALGLIVLYLAVLFV